jgi:N-carbamoyl-L-amino-acid hydrolase
MSFVSMWADLAPIGRQPRTGGYRRFAWTAADGQLRDWFAAEASRRGLHLTEDRAGNQWAWWGDPDAALAADTPGVVAGSHLDSVPDGGAFDGPLGVVSAFAAIDLLRARGFAPARPIGVVNFGDEEGARFGVACAGSRLLTGVLTAERALGLRDVDGVELVEAMRRAGRDPNAVGPDPQVLRRIGTFVELHVEQGRGLVDLGQPVAVASSIWPHGRWRCDLPGQANHAGTTRLTDRQDAMLSLATLVHFVRLAAERQEIVATIGKVAVEPNGVNAIASRVTAWLDARAAEADRLRVVLDEIAAVTADLGGTMVEESATAGTSFDVAIRDRLAGLLGGAPLLATGAGHDAGILAAAGVPSAMVFVRNEPDCLAGVDALAAVLAELAG